MRTGISEPPVEWSDKKDGGDQPEDRRTLSPQAGSEYEDWCEPRWNFEDNPGPLISGVVANLAS